MWPRLVKVSAVLVFHIQVHRANTYSVLQHATLPQVFPVCHMLPADLTYYGACSYTASLRSTLFCYNHQVSSTTQCVSVLVSCSKCLLYVDYVFQGKVSWYFMFYQASPYLYCSFLEKKSADEAIGVKKGDIFVIFQPPFYQ